MLGIVRLYVEPNEAIPECVRPTPEVPIIDCNPDEVYEIRRGLKKLGFDVIAVPI